MQSKAKSQTRRKLVKSKKPNVRSVTDRTREFKITLQNKFALLDGQNEDSADTLNDNLTTAITESAAATGEAACRKQTRKLTRQTKELISQRQKMIFSSTVDQNELAELSKWLNKSKTNLSSHHCVFMYTLCNTLRRRAFRVTLK